MTVAREQATATIQLTSFSLSIAARVVRHVGQIAKGADATGDAAFEIVARVLDAMIHNGKQSACRKVA